MAFSELAHIYLEDSWVLDVAGSERAVRFAIEAVLTPDHAAYQSPPADEQHCYRRATLVVSSTEPISYEPSGATPARDAAKDIDYGNIDSFTTVDWDGAEAWELSGDWGTAVVKQPTVTLTLDR